MNKRLTKYLCVLAFSTALVGCGGEAEDDLAAKAKKNRQELQEKIQKRAEFAQKHCKGTDVDCEKLMEEAGLSLP